MMAFVRFLRKSVAGEDGNEALRLGKIREDPLGFYTGGSICMGMLSNSISMTCNLSTRETFRRPRRHMVIRQVIVR